MSATYYQPSGRVPFLGPVVAVVIGGILIAVFALLYAAALVYNPSAYLGIALPIFYGAAAGGVVSALGRRFKIRNATVLAGLGTAMAMGGYLLSWIPWVWITLCHLGSEVDVIAVLYPPSLLDILGLLYENGAWSIGSSGGAVSGLMLALVWLLEAIIILIASAFTAFAVGSYGVFCETCEEWAAQMKGLFRHEGSAGAQLMRQLEAHDVSVLTSAPAADPASNAWIETELTVCGCGATNTLLVEKCTRAVDGRGNARVERLPIVSHLLITKQQAQWVRTAAGR